MYFFFVCAFVHYPILRGILKQHHLLLRIINVTCSLKTITFLLRRRANLVENMILMLEKYSKSLEEIVEDRTTSLREEKHKVEALLERMLPKSVANQLMQGREVCFFDVSLNVSRLFNVHDSH